MRFLDNRGNVRIRKFEPAPAIISDYYESSNASIDKRNRVFQAELELEKYRVTMNPLFL